MSFILPLIAGVGLMVGQPATRPAEQPATRPATRPLAVPDDSPATAEEGRLLAEQHNKLLLEGSPLVESGKIGDLLGARLENGFLLIELKAEPEQWPLALRLEDVPGAVAELAPIPRPRPLAEEDSPAPSRFRLFVHRPGKPGERDYATHVELYSGPLIGQMNLSMVRERVGGSLNVQLMQLVAGLEDEPGVRLHVALENYEDRAGDIDTSARAASFQELAREEPELFEQYVRPMLAELKIAGVLEGGVRKVAMQVFLADLPVEPAVREQVAALLKRLDAADFAVRDEAQRELEALGRPAATALLSLAREQELSLEQSTRVKAIVSAYQPLEAEALRDRRDDPDFLRQVAELSGSPEDDALAKLARQRLEELGAEPATRPAPK